MSPWSGGSGDGALRVASWFLEPRPRVGAAPLPQGQPGNGDGPARGGAGTAAAGSRDLTGSAQ